MATGTGPLLVLPQAKSGFSSFFKLEKQKECALETLSGLHTWPFTEKRADRLPNPTTFLPPNSLSSTPCADGVKVLRSPRK